jgi:formylmethanofuran dehydrogenase subunit E
MNDETICGFSFDQFVIDMEAFHGDRAPGIVVGGLMLEAALAKVGETPDLAIVVETYNCLPDAAQMLTHCTIGNGGLTVYDWGKFALTAYNRNSLTGVRTWIVTEAVARWPLIDQWFNPTRPRSGPPEFESLAKELIRARSELIGLRDVNIVLKEDAGQKKKTCICPDCGESYFLKCGSKCSTCQGMAYYVV